MNKIIEQFKKEFDWRELQYNEAMYVPTKNVEAFILKSLKTQREETIKEIERMTLWTKGNSEGTRQDILYKLKNNKYE